MNQQKNKGYMPVHINREILDDPHKLELGFFLVYFSTRAAFKPYTDYIKIARDKRQSVLLERGQLLYRQDRTVRDTGKTKYRIRKIIEELGKLGKIKTECRMTASNRKIKIITICNYPNSGAYEISFQPQSADFNHNVQPQTKSDRTGTNG